MKIYQISALHPAHFASCRSLVSPPFCVFRPLIPQLSSHQHYLLRNLHIWLLFLKTHGYLRMHTCANACTYNGITHTPLAHLHRIPPERLKHRYSILVCHSAIWGMLSFSVYVYSSSTNPISTLHRSNCQGV